MGVRAIIGVVRNTGQVISMSWLRVILHLHWFIEEILYLVLLLSSLDEIGCFDLTIINNHIFVVAAHGS